VNGVQHWLVCELQTCPLEQSHSSVFPQPSETRPHRPGALHAIAWGIGVQHCVDRRSQTCPVGQPHTCVPPHPSETVPHCAPHAVGTQQVIVVALQTCPAEHAFLQSTTPPQPSGNVPHMPA
jgi:hypothetical protein